MLAVFFDVISTFMVFLSISVKFHNEIKSSVMTDDLSDQYISLNQKT